MSRRPYPYETPKKTNDDSDKELCKRLEDKIEGLEKRLLGSEKELAESRKKLAESEKELAEYKKKLVESKDLNGDLKKEIIKSEEARTALEKELAEYKKKLEMAGAVSEASAPEATSSKIKKSGSLPSFLTEEEKEADLGDLDAMCALRDSISARHERAKVRDDMYRRIAD